MKRKYSLEEIYYVYLLIDPRIDTPFYVGKGKGRRCSTHVKSVLSEKKSDNVRKDAIIKDILKESLHVVIFMRYTKLDEKTAFDKEDRLIIKYGRKGFESYGILTNLCLGERPPEQLKGKSNPRFGTKRSKKTIEKIKKARARQAPPNAETRRKISCTRTGMKFTEEHKKNLKIARHERKEKGTYFHSDETRKKMSESHIGHKHTDATKRKISESRIRNENARKLY